MKGAARWILAGLLTSTLSCQELADLREDVEDAMDEPIVQQALGLTVAGVSPATDFRETGRLEFDVLAENEQSGLVELANLQSGGMQVEVENDDGTYSDCEYVGGETHEAPSHHALTLLLDGSGSMELAYPPATFGNTCVTCPHDPTRERIVAANDLIFSIVDASPESPMAIAEFGPDPTGGFAATRLHSDFVNDPVALSRALDGVQGYEPVGTPLYDSLAEMLEETAVVAQALEETVVRGSGEAVGRHIIVLSDGEDNESTMHDVNSVIDVALDLGVAVYVVGLGPASAANAPDTVDPVQTQAVRNLQVLAQETGGFYAAATNPSELRALYDVLGRALTQGYQTETYECIPRPTQETPEEDCDVPPVGSRMDGRVRMGDVTIPWVTIAN